jgi:hypothetical protein
MIKNPEDIVRRAVAAAHEELGDLSLPKRIRLSSTTVICQEGINQRKQRLEAELDASTRLSTLRFIERLEPYVGRKLLGGTLFSTDSLCWVWVDADLEKVVHFQFHIFKAPRQPNDHNVLSVTPVDFEIEELLGDVRWSLEYFASFKNDRSTDPNLAEDNLRYLDDSLNKTYKNLKWLEVLLRAGCQATLHPDGHRPDS